MRDKAKTKSQLIDELNQMRQKIAELEPEPGAAHQVPLHVAGPRTAAWTCM